MRHCDLLCPKGKKAQKRAAATGNISSLLSFAAAVVGREKKLPTGQSPKVKLESLRKGFTGTFDRATFALPEAGFFSTTRSPVMRLVSVVSEVPTAESSVRLAKPIRYQSPS